MYSIESINKVRAVGIVAVVSRFIKLDRHNKSCCPFHNEKTPSFSVSPIKGIFKCYGCGAGGDAITFVKKHQRIDFIAAIELIADFENITLETEKNFDRDAYIKLREEKKTLRQIINVAHQKYTAQLFLHQNKEALDYWISRGYNDDAVSYWGLGFAPLNAGFLTREFTTSGSLPEAIKAGLCKEKDNGLHRDFFINRVMIPIVDETGDLVTFAGRKIHEDNDYPKYINGIVTDLYNKSKVLFGLYQAIPSIIEFGFAILTEGYTDVITMHTAGATNTIATCGTAFTEDMARLLKKYTDHVVLMRDGDAAGQKAEDKDLMLLLKFNFKVEIVPLKESKDPDNYAREFITEFKDEDFIAETDTQDSEDDETILEFVSVVAEHEPIINSHIPYNNSKPK